MFVVGVMVAGLVSASTWGFKAKIVPLIVGTLGLIVAALSLFKCIREEDSQPFTPGKVVSPLRPLSRV